MDIHAITQQMIVLFLLISVGFIANKKGVMNSTFNKLFSAFVVNITTPATILNSVLSSDRMLSNGEVLLLMAIALSSFLIVIIASNLVPKLFRVKPEDAGMMRFMTIFSNVGFMGFPVVSALFGESAVFYAAIFNMPFNVLSFSYGIRLVSNGRYGGFDKKTLLSPCIVCSLLSILLYFLNLSLPAVITEPISYLSAITVPGAMLIIGSSLAQMPLNTVFRDWRIYALSGIKLLLMPVLTYLALRPFPLNPLIVQVTVVMWAMPVATNATILATQYDGNGALASKGVLISTLFSILTIPTVMWVLFLC